MKGRARFAREMGRGSRALRGGASVTLENRGQNLLMHLIALTFWQPGQVKLRLQAQELQAAARTWTAAMMAKA